MDKSQISLAIKEEIQRQLLGEQQVNEGLVTRTLLRYPSIGEPIAKFLLMIEKHYVDSAARENLIKKDELMSKYLNKIFSNQAFEKRSESLAKMYASSQSIEEIEKATKAVRSFMQMLEDASEKASRFKMTDQEFSEFNQKKSLMPFFNRYSVVSKSKLEREISYEIVKIMDQRIFTFQRIINDADNVLFGIKEEIQRNILGQQEQVNEDFGLTASLTLAALAGVYSWSRKIIIDMRKDSALKAFIEQHDKTDVINKRIPTILKKFKLVASLTDLHNIENEVKAAKSEITRLIVNVDAFVDEMTKTQNTTVTKYILSNPEYEKVRLKKYMNQLYKDTEESFDKAIKAKTDELLG